MACDCVKPLFDFKRKKLTNGKENLKKIIKIGKKQYLKNIKRAEKSKRKKRRIMFFQINLRNFKVYKKTCENRTER